VHQEVEILPHLRRSLRRAVEIPCQVVSPYWDEPVSYLATEISRTGMWIDTPFPLSCGDALVVRFEAPRPRDAGVECDRGMFMLARVRRVELRRRRDDRHRAGMGVEFVSVAPEEEALLTSCLRGIPPRIPETTWRPPRARVWVDPAP
jgi:hypothetical protein